MKKRTKAAELIRNDPRMSKLFEFEGIGERERSDPDWCRQYLICLAQDDPRLYRSEAYAASMQILHEAAEEAALSDKAVRAYWSAIESGVVTKAEADRLVQDPAALRAKVAEIQRTNSSWYWSEVGQAAASAV